MLLKELELVVCDPKGSLLVDGVLKRLEARSDEGIELELLLLDEEAGVFQRAERSDAAVFELDSGVEEGCIHHARSEPDEELDEFVAGAGSAAGADGASHHYSEPLSFLMAYTLATQAT